MKKIILLLFICLSLLTFVGCEKAIILEDTTLTTQTIDGEEVTFTVKFTTNKLLKVLGPSQHEISKNVEILHMKILPELILLVKDFEELKTSYKELGLFYKENKDNLNIMKENELISNIEQSLENIILKQKDLQPSLDYFYNLSENYIEHYNMSPKIIDDFEKVIKEIVEVMNSYKKLFEENINELKTTTTVEEKEEISNKLIKIFER